VWPRRLVCCSHQEVTWNMATVHWPQWGQYMECAEVCCVCGCNHLSAHNPGASQSFLNNPHTMKDVNKFYSILFYNIKLQTAVFLIVKPKFKKIWRWKRYILQNVYNHKQDYMVPKPRSWSTFSLSQKCQILYNIRLLPGIMLYK